MLGPSLCVKKNSEYPPGVLRKLFEHKANRPVFKHLPRAMKQKYTRQKCLKF